MVHQFPPGVCNWQYESADLMSLKGENYSGNWEFYYYLNYIERGGKIFADAIKCQLGLLLLLGNIKYFELD